MRSSQPLATAILHFVAIWGVLMRLAVAAAVCLSAVGLSVADPAHASMNKKNLNLPAQELRQALLSFSKASGLRVIFISEDVGSRRTGGVVGEFTPDEALRRLLKGTGLTFSYLDAKTVTIVPVALSSESPTSSATAPAAGAVVGQQSPNAGGFWNSVLLAQGTQGSPPRIAAMTSSDQSAAVTSKEGVLEEVVVTAQKKSERLLDVPVPVTVLDAQTLASNNLNRIQDYYATVPGLNLDASPGIPGGGRQYLQIRGVGTTAFSSPTVAVLIDEIPIGGSTANSSATQLSPDIDPSDLARVEVLKGPQGTLYGADSLGGLVKFVTLDPSTSGFSGRVEMLGNAVVGAGQGYGVRGAANIPVSDALAFRISGFSRQDPGYIDNVTTGANDVNVVNTYGGRVGILWNLSDAISLKVSALFQNTYGDGSSHIDADASLQPSLGDLKQSGIAGAGTYKNLLRLYAATLNAKVSNVELTSITGYGVTSNYGVFDVSSYYGYLWNTIYPNGPVAMGVALPSLYETDKFSQEIRLSSSFGNWLRWIGGVFYTHESDPSSGNAGAYNATTAPSGAYVGTLNTYTDTQSFSEFAIFGDLTFHITDRLDVQFGGRQSWNKQTYSEEVSGVGTEVIWGQPSPYVVPEVRSSGDAFTYLVTPEYKISPDTMAYARIASGYRVGGPNLPPLAPGAPTSYKPDKTTNYELGVKSDILDHRLTIDASIYYIDWRDIQINVYIPPSGFGTNGGHAKSEGVELSIQARPTSWTQISLAAAYNEAELTENLPPNASAYGVAGDRLPFSPRYMGTISVDQDVAHVGDAAGYVGASASYIGLRYGEFESISTTPRFVYPEYTLINAHAGVRVASWSVNVFGNNLANRRGIIGGDFSGSYGTAGYFAQVVQPRTVGASFTKSF